MAVVRHNFPPFMVRFFDEMVLHPYEEHPKTDAWQKQIRGGQRVAEITGKILAPREGQVRRRLRGTHPRRHAPDLLQLHDAEAHGD